MELLIFGFDISGWIEGGGVVLLAGLIVMILRKKGLIFKVKSFFGLMHRVTEEIGEAFIASSDVFGAADKAIKEDGTLKENSVKDVIAAGKEAVIEWKDVVLIVKPKKQ